MAEKPKKEEAAETIRVNLDLLDKLMNQVGELVLIRNQVQQFDIKSPDPALFLNLSQRLNTVTSELQDEVMRTRMQPIGKILSKFHRVVRDISHNLDKKIELELEGTETELDKSLIEAVKDPLTHIVRNACDHGIEVPAERRQAGKPEHGSILIKSYHEGGQVIVEISDNGKGLDREKLLHKAVNKGLLNHEEGGRMSDREVFNLIFHPGFSTAEQVSNLSGRGVGMDVVKSNIERIGGMVDLDSVTGSGTTLRLRIPLTLAILPALIVGAGDQLFTIPQVKLVELLRIDNSSGAGGIEELEGQPVYRLRGHLLPLVSLRQVLFPGQEPTPAEPGDDQSAFYQSVQNIVVLKSDQITFGLIVDEIKDSADIVVKSLSNFLKSHDVYSGATVMGDGTVALVLDVNGIARQADLSSDQTGSSYGVRDSNGKSRRGSTREEEFLLVNPGIGGHYAMQLEQVNRLEEFAPERFEVTGDQEVVRYRDTLLPVINVRSFLGMEAAQKQQTDTDRSVRSIVVVRHRGKLVGMEVDEILDVLSVTTEIETDIRDRRGILGNLVLEDRVVVVLDILEIIDKSMLAYLDDSDEAESHPTPVLKEA